MILAKADYAAPCKANNTCPSSVDFVAPSQVAHPLKAAEQLVHGLFAHACALGQLSRPHAIGSGVLQDRDMRQTQIVETGII